MESSNDKIMRLFGLIATNGNQFNDLKLEQLLKIAGQPDINIEMDQDNVGVVNQPAANVTTVSDDPTTRRSEYAPGTWVDSEQPAKRRRQTNVNTRLVQDLTQDQGGGRITGCVCAGHCSRDCTCHKAGGACSKSCGCKGEGACELRIKIFDALFGYHLNVKLTPCFVGYVSHVSQGAHRNRINGNTLRLLTLLGAQQTGMDILLAKGCSNEAGNDHRTELRDLVRSLRAQALALKNDRIPEWPFTFATEWRGGAALVAWHGRWRATSGRETRETPELDQELLRYAFTDKPHHDCYYSLCEQKWASKSVTSHCEACKQCIFVNLALHHAEIHDRSSDED